MQQIRAKIRAHHVPKRVCIWGFIKASSSALKHHVQMMRMFYMNP